MQCRAHTWRQLLLHREWVVVWQLYVVNVHGAHVPAAAQQKSNTHIAKASK
jgi:hypothetical protein